MYLILIRCCIRESLQWYLQVERLAAIVRVVHGKHLMLTHTSWYVTLNIEVPVLLLIFSRTPLLLVSGRRVYLGP